MNALETRSWCSLTSRSHPLNQFGQHWYVKREDELSGAIKGNKLRKYASLLPCWKQHNIEKLFIIAGPQSNNLLAAAQIAREHGLSITALLLKPWSALTQGNFLYSQLFLDEQDIIWVEREDWLEVDKLANDLKSKDGESSFVLPEGAAVVEALPGAMTLGEDIARNEAELGIAFQHIVIDAGTGFSAMALAHWLSENQHPAQLHIVLMADEEGMFRQKLIEWLGYVPQNMTCHYPETAKAFGAVNQTIRNEIAQTAREEGFLLDPLYSAKLFYTARIWHQQQKLSGNVLLIHSG